MAVYQVGSMVPKATTKEYIYIPTVNYEREALFTTNKTSVTVPAGTVVRVGDKVLVSTKETTIQLTTAGTASALAGKDVYLYACQPDSGHEPVFILSPNSTVPTGYTAQNSRKIGGFHCLCANVGTIATHALSGYVAGDILPASVWDLRHRARSENEGMVFDERLGLWVDIYLASWNAAKTLLVSAYKGNVITGTVPAGTGLGGPLVGESFIDCFATVKKRLPWRSEFQIFSIFSNTETSIQGAANPGTTGGHVDTANRRMISDIGVEDACGVFWQWVQDTYEGGAYGTLTAANNPPSLGGYLWNMGMTEFNSVLGEGAAYGYLRRGLVGGNWGDGSLCGRRTVICRHASACVTAHHAARGVSEPRIWGV